MTDVQIALASEVDDVERHPCPRCSALSGSPCCSRSGAVAGTYHTGRFTKVPRLSKLGDWQQTGTSSGTCSYNGTSGVSSVTHVEGIKG
ncbi:zinc finger domain-containing protein [Streptomyces sp. NBC_01244]|uniref:zinc finger domain-containing protein n=1 Tax=Streptomyces sp. NBC_01244 TaxID=2903797 RepID=UPI002E0DE32F